MRLRPLNYLTTFGVMICIATWGVGEWLRPSTDPFTHELAGKLGPFAMFGMLIVAGLYGLLRVKLVHPFNDICYMASLAITPWEPGKPLPFGRVQLGWTDAIFAALLTGMWAAYFVTRDVHLPWLVWLLPAVILFGVYVVTLWRCSFDVIHRSSTRVCYACTYLFGLAALCAVDAPYVTVATLIVAYALLRSLLGEPFEHRLRRHLRDTTPAGVRFLRDAIRDNTLAGLHRRLGPDTQPVTEVEGSIPWLIGRIRRRWGEVLAGLLIAGPVVWWLYVASVLVSHLMPHASIARHDESEPSVIFLFYGLALVAATFGVLVIDIAGYGSPITLWGRLSTGRWIIPGYDIVYVMPLGMLLIGVAIPHLAALLGLPPVMQAAAALPVLVTWWLLSRRWMDDWRFTGAHHISTVPVMTPDKRRESTGRPITTR